MKKTVLFAVSVAMLILCVSLSSACDKKADKGGNGDASTVTDGLTVTLTPDDGINIEDAKIEALRILTPRASDKEPIMDGIVHRYRYGHGNKTISDKLKAALGEDYVSSLRLEQLGQLYLMRSSENGAAPALMCDIEGCEHNDITCPAVMGNNNLVLPVTDEKTGRTVVYTELALDASSVPIRGKSVNLLKEFGMPDNLSDGSARELHVLFEYDPESGARRAVTADPFMANKIFSSANMYYNGRLYFGIWGWASHDPEYHDEHPRLLYVDIASGEVKYCEEPDGEKSFLYFAGINEEKIYCLSEAGDVVKMNLDFGEREVLGKIDNFTTELMHENGSGSIFALYNRNAAFADGCMYIETFDSDLNDEVTYKCPLSGDWKPEAVPISISKDIYMCDDGDFLENVEYYYYIMQKDGFRK